MEMRDASRATSTGFSVDMYISRLSGHSVFTRVLSDSQAYNQICSKYNLLIYIQRVVKKLERFYILHIISLYVLYSVLYFLVSISNIILYILIGNLIFFFTFIAHLGKSYLQQY